MDARNIRYVGARTLFVEKTSSKLVMKRILKTAQVSTAPWFESVEEVKTAMNVGKKQGSVFPLIVKTDRGSGSEGLQETSVVNSVAELETEWKRMEEIKRGVFAEKFIRGREFTVLVTGRGGNLEGLNFNVNAGVKVFPPVERVFPDFSGFKTDDQYWHPAYHHQECPEELRGDMVALVGAAFEALEGNAVARVDVRLDVDTSTLYVLDVNTYPCFGYLDSDTIGMASVLKAGNYPLDGFLKCLFADADCVFGEDPAAERSTTAAK